MNLKQQAEDLAHLERLTRESIRGYLDKELPVSRVRELDQARRIPREIWRDLGDLGVMGVLVPEKFGGQAADVRIDYAVIEELAKRFASLAAGYMVVSMAARLFSDVGTPQQKSRVLPALARGEKLVSFGLTEPDTGTDMNNLRASAEEVDGMWRISGQKLFITLADDADHLVVLARTDPPREGHSRNDGLSLILTDKNQSGIEVRRLAMAGLRAAGTTEIFIDGAEAPLDAIVGERGRGFRTLVRTLNHERILQAYMALGIGATAFAETKEYALTRTAFNGPIARFQAIQHPLAVAHVELEAARLLSNMAADLEAEGEASVMAAAMAKYAAGEAALKCVDHGLRVQAGYGLTEESDMMRLMRDVRDMVSGPITNEMAKNLIAERLGMPRSY